MITFLYPLVVDTFVLVMDVMKVVSQCVFLHACHFVCAGLCY